MSRNYERARVDKRWADSRNTHIAVATAIHAIADSTRTADRIWEDPSPAECDRVKMAVEEYIEHGDFPAAPDGRYSWGCEVVELPASTYTFALYHPDEGASFLLATVKDGEDIECEIQAAEAHTGETFDRDSVEIISGLTLTDTPQYNDQVVFVAAALAVQLARHRNSSLFTPPVTGHDRY